MRLYPRLPSAIARTMAAELADKPIIDLRAGCAVHHPLATYGPVGGYPAVVTDLAHLQQGVRQIAADCGYPEPIRQPAKGRFDSEVSIFLHVNMETGPWEASHKEIWQFITCVMLPDVVRWRFFGESAGSTIVNRFLGGAKNVFGRLWWRAEILRDDAAADPFWMVKGLAEDELVQIHERTGMAGCRKLSRILAGTFLEIVEGHGTGAKISNRMKIMRETQKRLMRLFAIVSFDVLPDETVKAMVSETIGKVVLQEQKAEATAGNSPEKDSMQG